MNINRERRGILIGAMKLGLGSILASNITNVAVAQEKAVMIKVVASRFTYAPNRIMLKRGVPVVLTLSTLDMPMGFNAPDFGVRTDIFPGKESSVRFTPDKAGEFVFHCDLFCGSGHEDMTGVLLVT